MKNISDYWQLKISFIFIIDFYVLISYLLIYICYRSLFIESYLLLISIFWLAAPYFIIPLKHQHVDKDSDLTWNGQADGRPAVTYKWFKNAEELIIANLPAADRPRYWLT